MCRPTPSHRLNAYCMVIVRVSYGYGYTRGSGRVWVRVASSATGTGRVAEMVDPHTPMWYSAVTKRENDYIRYGAPLWSWGLIVYYQ